MAGSLNVPGFGLRLYQSPVASRRPLLKAGLIVLEQGRTLFWIPEGPFCASPVGCGQRLTHGSSAADTLNTMELPGVGPKGQSHLLGSRTSCRALPWAPLKAYRLRGDLVKG